MPTRRTRVAHGASVPSEVYALLGMGCGWNSHPNEYLQEQWRTWGEEVERMWQRDYGKESWATFIARQEDWD